MKIAIAGAGIGGLSVAALLASEGHEVHIFDQFKNPAPVGSGLVIQPVGLDVLHRIGTADIALGYGRKITRMLGHEAQTGRTVLDVSYTRARAKRFGLALHRSALFEAVLQGARRAGATLHTDYTITGVTPRPRTLFFSDGTKSEPFELIIDSTGAGSPLSPLKGRALPFGALWGTVDWPDDTDLPRNQLSQVYRHADRMMGVLPIGRLPGESGDKATVFWSLPKDDHPNWLARPLDNWIDEATTLWPKFAPFIEQITDHNQMTMTNYSHGTLNRVWQDGLVHIGDAAHKSSPQLGQGANMALLDAYALASALRLAQGREALALYARLRRWHVRTYQGMSWAFTPQYQSYSRILPALRDRVLAPMSQIWPLPKVLSKLVCGDLVQPFAGLPEVQKARLS